MVSHLDRVDSFIGEAGYLEVCPDLYGLLGEFSLDVLHQNSFGIFIQTEIIQERLISNSLLEVVIGRPLLFTLLFKMPGSFPKCNKF